MSWLKAYEWEHKKWPWQQTVKVRGDFRAGFTHALARHFGYDIELHLTKEGGGHAWASLAGWGRNVIALPRPDRPCSLGVILHEIAHIVNARLYNGRGHTGTFRKAIIKVYVESRAVLKEQLLAAKSIAEKARAELQESAKRNADRVEREAERRAQAKATRKSRAFRIDRLRERIRKTESRLKRNTTMLKSAKRSLAILERLEAANLEKTDKAFPRERGGSGRDTKPAELQAKEQK